MKIQIILIIIIHKKILIKFNYNFIFYIYNICYKINNISHTSNIIINYYLYINNILSTLFKLSIIF